MIGNKIEIKDLKSHEIEIAKCGLLCLVWVTTPGYYGVYEIRSNGKNIFVTNSLAEAINKYNEYVK